MEYVIGAAVLIVLVITWWGMRRPLSPTELEPMSRQWLSDKKQHRLDHWH